MVFPQASVVTRLRRRCGARDARWWCVGLAVLAAIVHLVRVPATAHLDAYLPAPPARIAHLLADFSHRHDGRAWTLEHEAGNYTSWRYTVAYSCGTRCSARVRLEAHEGPAAEAAPQHGQGARPHTVLVKESRCVSPPLLSWPQHCEEVESEVRVKISGSGSLVSERARAWCSCWRAISGACGAELRYQLAERMRRVQASASAAALLVHATS